MHSFEVLGDPVRRRILDFLREGERSAGEVVADVQASGELSQPAVSRHLRVLRDHGFARVRAVGTRRIYTVDPTPLREIDAWLAPYRAFWEPRLDALAVELAQGSQPCEIGTHPNDRSTLT